MTSNEGDLEASWEALVTGAADRWISDGPERKQNRSRRRRLEILEAATRVFARDGIARARIVDVAAEAGVPLSSVYDYYPSKEELAYALPISRMGEFYGDFAEKARRPNPAKERLHLFLWLTAD